MNATVRKLLDEALELPKSDRARLAILLFESVDSGSEEEQEESLEALIERRLTELETGAAQAIPWEETRRKVWERVGRHAAD